MPKRKSRKSKCKEELKTVTKKPKLEEDTRVVGESLRQRACNALESGRWADCQFLVGEDKGPIQACRNLLAIASPVFEAMLYGDMASTRAVEVPDIEPDVFKQLLKYIYCHQVKLSSIEEAFALFSAAHMYMMPDLCDLCVRQMKHHLMSLKKSWQMWCEALNFACFYKIEDLKQFVLKEVGERGRTLLNTSPDLLILDAESLLTVVQQNHLDVESEVEVVAACTRWATACCEEKGLPANGRHLRDILEEMQCAKTH